MGRGTNLSQWKYCGTITSAGYAHTLERMTCLGFVTDTDNEGRKILHKAMHEFILDKSAKYEIAIAGKKFPAEVNLYTKPIVTICGYKKYKVILIY